MKHLLLSFLAIGSFYIAISQEKFVFEGRIEYERRINVHRQAEEDQSSEWFKEFIKKSPPFHSSLFTLYFNAERSLYKLSEELPRFEMTWLLGPAKENVVQQDLATNIRKSHKTVFEKKFIVTDSMWKPEWRITDEKRTIAGIECRKAVTVICDSVYVVAFYADEIPVSSGPETFGGLPGMILGLAVPRLHTTWFATKVNLAAPVAKELEFSAKGQATDKPKLLASLNTAFENWGKYRDKNIWWILL